MKKIALTLAMVATLAATATSPAEARGWRGGGWRGGWGSGIGLGIGWSVGSRGVWRLWALRLRPPILRLLRAAICVLRTRLLSAALLLRMVNNARRREHRKQSKA
jgi:hypothetical protein